MPASQVCPAQADHATIKFFFEVTLTAKNSKHNQYLHGSISPLLHDKIFGSHAENFLL